VRYLCVPPGGLCATNDHLPATRLTHLRLTKITFQNFVRPQLCTYATCATLEILPLGTLPLFLRSMVLLYSVTRFLYLLSYLSCTPYLGTYLFGLFNPNSHRVGHIGPAELAEGTRREKHSM
jgi:hypothetical protein